VVPVAVDAGWREEGGQPIQKLQGREAQRGAAGWVGHGQDVQNLVRPAADEVEAVEGEGSPGKTNASGRCPRMSRSSPSRSVASMRTLALRLNPPPCSQVSRSSALWGSRRP
jgi:hypothetical protein